jgi:hypothetical protein
LHGVAASLSTGKDVSLFEELGQSVDLVSCNGDTPAFAESLANGVDNVRQSTGESWGLDDFDLEDGATVSLPGRAKRK